MVENIKLAQGRTAHERSGRDKKTRIGPGICSVKDYMPFGMASSSRVFNNKRGV